MCSIITHVEISGANPHAQVFLELMLISIYHTMTFEKHDPQILPFKKWVSMSPILESGWKLVTAPTKGERQK